MSNQYISYDVTKTLSKLLIQFLEGNSELDSFYGLILSFMNSIASTGFMSAMPNNKSILL